MILGSDGLWKDASGGDASALPKGGGTMTGDIVLKGDPTADLHPVTRQYVEKPASATPAPGDTVLGLVSGALRKFAARLTQDTWLGLGGLAGEVARPLGAKLGDLSSVKDFGAIGDGTSHPVSQWLTGGARARGYANLAAIQAVYPHVASLSDEIDWAAIQKALNVLSFNADLVNNIDATGVVRVPGGAYLLNKDLEVKKTVHLKADGPGFFGGRPAIFRKTANGNATIIVHAYNTTGAGVEAPPTTGADGSVIEGIYFDAGGGVTSLPYGAVWARVKCELRRLQAIDLPAHGFCVIATSGGGGAAEGNANGWIADTLYGASCGGSVLYIDGSDANAGVSRAISGKDCARLIWDSSFLGNHHEAPEAQDCTSGPYYTDNPNQQTTFVNLYAEGGQPGIVGSQGTLFVNGQLGDSFDPGNRFVQPNANGLEVGPNLHLALPASYWGTPRNATVGLGASGWFVKLTQTGDESHGLALRIGADGEYVFRHGNDTARNGLAITSDLTAWTYGRGAALGGGQVLLPLGAFLGGPDTGQDARFLGYASAAPTTGSHARGEFLVNFAPSAGAPFAWVCVTSGTPGTWAPAGWVGQKETFPVAISDETTALTTGTAKVTFRMPFAMTLTEVRTSVTTAPTGATLVTNVKESGTTIFSTKPIIAIGAKTNTAAVLSDTSLADNAEMTVDIDQVGSTVAGAGLKLYMIGYRT